MITRGQNFESVDLNVVGSSVFGRYPKISVEKTYNMFISDGFLVDYAGFEKAIPTSLGGVGRGIFTSTKLNRLVVVMSQNVYLVNIFFDQNLEMTFDYQFVLIGTLQTSVGKVYITENNKPQIVISDGMQIYYYDPTLTPSFQIAYQDTLTPPTPLNFVPGYIDFHDTYILAAASQDNTYSPPANNTWRLGIIDPVSSKLIFPSNSSSVGLLQTKPDNTQAVVRFPSRGNMIFVIGKIVAEPWFDIGGQLFPYQRNSSFNCDYGCLNPATIARNDEIVVWLAENETTGPIIVYSTGQTPEKITTDGIDYLFSNMKNPADASAFIYRQDGHLIYHINFYTDNLSLFYDFNTQKFFHASDQNLNYFIGSEVAFFNNQYYMISNKNGFLYAFDTIYTTYDGAEVPRIRTCKNIRKKSQEYFVANDIGFTIEQGETPYQQESTGDIFLITQDGKKLITQGMAIFLQTQDHNYLETQNLDLLITQTPNNGDFNYLIAEQQGYNYLTPRVDLSISTDGGASFGSDFPYWLNPIGRRKNKLMWWQIGVVNDLVCQFKFWGLGRFVATDGTVNIRT